MTMLASPCAQLFKVMAGFILILLAGLSRAQTLTSDEPLAGSLQTFNARSEEFLTLLNPRGEGWEKQLEPVLDFVKDLRKDPEFISWMESFTPYVIKSANMKLDEVVKDSRTPLEFLISLIQVLVQDSNLDNTLNLLKQNKEEDLPKVSLSFLSSKQMKDENVSRFYKKLYIVKRKQSMMAPPVTKTVLENMPEQSIPVPSRSQTLPLNVPTSREDLVSLANILLSLLKNINAAEITTNTPLPQVSASLASKATVSTPTVTTVLKETIANTQPPTIAATENTFTVLTTTVPTNTATESTSTVLTTSAPTPTTILSTSTMLTTTVSTNTTPVSTSTVLTTTAPTITTSVSTSTMLTTTVPTNTATKSTSTLLTISAPTIITAESSSPVSTTISHKFGNNLSTKSKSLEDLRKEISIVSLTSLDDIRKFFGNDDQTSTTETSTLGSIESRLAEVFPQVAAAMNSEKEKVTFRPFSKNYKSATTTVSTTTSATTNVATTSSMTMASTKRRKPEEKILPSKIWVESEVKVCEPSLSCVFQGRIFISGNVDIRFDKFCEVEHQLAKVLQPAMRQIIFDSYLGAIGNSIKIKHISQTSDTSAEIIFTLHVSKLTFKVEADTLVDLFNEMRDELFAPYKINRMLTEVKLVKPDAIFNEDLIASPFVTESYDEPSISPLALAAIMVSIFVGCPFILWISIVVVRRNRSKTLRRQIMYTAPVVFDNFESAISSLQSNNLHSHTVKRRQKSKSTIFDIEREKEKIYISTIKAKNAGRLDKNLDPTVAERPLPLVPDCPPYDNSTLQAREKFWSKILAGKAAASPNIEEEDQQQDDSSLLEPSSLSRSVQDSSMKRLQQKYRLRRDQAKIHRQVRPTGVAYINAGFQDDYGDIINIENSLEFSSEDITTDPIVNIPFNEYATIIKPKKSKAEAMLEHKPARTVDFPAEYATIVKPKKSKDEAMLKHEPESNTEKNLDATISGQN